MKLFLLLLLLCNTQIFALNNDECDMRNLSNTQVYYSIYSSAQFDKAGQVIMPAAWKQNILHTSPIYENNKLVSPAEYSYSGICMLDENVKMVPYRASTKMSSYYELYTSVRKAVDGIKTSAIVKKMTVSYHSPKETKYRISGVFLNGKRLSTNPKTTK